MEVLKCLCNSALLSMESLFAHGAAPSNDLPPGGDGPFHCLKSHTSLPSPYLFPPPLLPSSPPPLLPCFPPSLLPCFPAPLRLLPSAKLKVDKESASADVGS
ncbi:hypothetical protein TcWFU_000012 [Taenia crassiceps]|uniref:Uncharacterized protein n=1 Tax=Taenia crassiceps TaxID=6207 RepID=A0ABR4QN44_9CEST